LRKANRGQTTVGHEFPPRLRKRRINQRPEQWRIKRPQSLEFPVGNNKHGDAERMQCISIQQVGAYVRYMEHCIKAIWIANSDEENSELELIIQLWKTYHTPKKHRAHNFIRGYVFALTDRAVCHLNCSNQLSKIEKHTPKKHTTPSG
jgi:hypothetical protein